MAGQVSLMKHCSNCKRDVAESNFVMHEIHCRRNIILCSKCGEPVPKVQLEEHLEENHALVDCDLCSRVVERSCLSEHKAELCSKRDKICSYCSLSVKAYELEDHESYCGTRTEQCVKCRSYIMHKDQNIHDESDCNLPERAESSSRTDLFYHNQSGVWNDSEFQVENDDDDYRRINHRYVDPYADCYFDVPRFDQKNLDSTVDLSLDRRGVILEKIETDRWCRSRPTEQWEDDKIFDEFLKFSNERKSNDMNEVDKIKDSFLGFKQDVAFLPCEFCDESFPADVIIHHQAECCNQFEEPRYSVFRDYGVNLFEKETKLGPVKRTLSGTLAKELTMLPCEFCSEPYPYDELMSHQLSCEVGRFLNNDVPADQVENVKRPPSLPSGLNKLGTDKSNAGSALRSSTSIPTGLSHLENSSVTAAVKPKSGATMNHSKNHAGIRKPISRQLPQVNHQFKESNDARPFRGIQIDDFSESPVSRLLTEVAGTNSPKSGFTTSKSNSTMNRPVISRQYTKDNRRKPLGSPGINPSSLQTNNYSRTMSTRLAAGNQTENQHTRTSHERQEQETGARRMKTGTTASINQKKNSRSSQDQHGSH